MVIGKKTRMTSQRMLVMNYLKSVCSHPTAEEVFKHVRKKMPSITLATVYRNLHLLADNGEILCMSVNNEYRFDATTNLHQHFVCSSCRNIEDIHDSRISRYILNKMKDKIPADNVEIIFKGTCKRCS